MTTTGDVGTEPAADDDAAARGRTGDRAAASEPAEEVVSTGPGQRRPRVRVGRVAALVTALALAGGLGHSSPMLEVAPGPAPDLMAALAAANPDGTANPALHAGGALHFTTVEATRMTWFGVLRCKVTGCESVLGATNPDDDQATMAAAAEEMAQAQADAERAARTLLGAPDAHPDAVLRVPTGDIGGPSAGLMMAVADVVALTEGDLTGGQIIAGTGSVSAQGAVGPIAGIAEKVHGATAVGAQVFFAPARQAQAASEAAPSTLVVVPVSTVGDAVSWLCSHGGQASSAC